MMSALSLISLALCISIVFNIDLTHSYLLCVGKEEYFRCVLHLALGGDIPHSPRYDPTDFYADPIPAGMEFKGPLWHPLRAMYNLTTWGMFLTVPFFYLAIFKFRRGQELTAGINENCIPRKLSSNASQKIIAFQRPQRK